MSSVDKIFKFEKKSNKRTFYIFTIPMISIRFDANNRIIFKKYFRNSLIFLFCCFIPSKKIRKAIRSKAKHYDSIIIKEYNYRRNNKPIEPYAFIRVKNEIGTIDACLKSILPVIKKGVIGYNDCDDGSEEYILNFCKDNPNYIPYKYPFEIFVSNDKILSEKNCAEEHKLYTYYNKVLELIPKNEWLIKIDCDHIFNEEKLRNLLYLPKNNNDVIIISRLNLHYDEKKLYFIKNQPILTTSDHWIIYNNNLEFTPLLCENKDLVEFLDISSRKLIFSEISNFHFPLLKKRRNNVRKEDLIDFDEFINSGSLAKYMVENKIPTILDEKILKGKFIENVINSLSN